MIVMHPIVPNHIVPSNTTTITHPKYRGGKVVPEKPIVIKTATLLPPPKGPQQPKKENAAKAKKEAPAKSSAKDKDGD